MTTAKPIPLSVHLAFDYDPETGAITNKFDRGSRARQGQEAGCINRNGYRQIRYEGVGYRAHRIAYYLQTGVDDVTRLIDHKDGNTSNNRFSNLRLLTTKQNSTARHKSYSSKASNHRGVCWSRRLKKWYVAVKLNGKQFYGGSYATEEEAAWVAVMYGHALHGEHNTYSMI